MFAKKKSIEQKLKARDEEIASLGTVLKCISENNLESQDLVKEINERIVDLEQQKENIVRSASGPSSKVEVQQPEEKTCAGEAVTQLQKAGEKQCDKEAVTVTVHKPEEKKRDTGVLLPINNQWGNISKRPRTAVTHPRFTPSPQYQRVFMPVPGAPQFGLPAAYFVPANSMGVARSGNTGTHYCGNSRPYPPFR